MPAQHPALSVGWPGARPALAVLPVHCPMAPYTPLPVSGTGCVAHAVGKHGNTHQPQNIPKKTHIHTLTPLSSAQLRSPLTLGAAGGSQFSWGSGLTAYPSARPHRGVSPWGKRVPHPGFDPQGPRGGPALLPRAALERARSTGVIALQSLAGTQLAPRVPHSHL